MSEIESSFTRQTLEFDADCNAVIMACRWALGTPEYAFLLSRDVQFDFDKHCTIALCGVFSILSGSLWRLDTQDNRTHPPSAIRTEYCTGVYTQVFVPNSAKDKDLIKSALHFDSYVYRDFADYNPMAESMKPYTFEGYMYLNRIRSEWANVRPILEALKIGRNSLAKVEDVKLYDVFS